MDMHVFWLVLSAGIALVAIQGLCARGNGFLSEAQMDDWGVPIGYSFLSHGGMWADVLIVSPLVASIAATYQMHFWSWQGLAVLSTTTVFWLILTSWYARDSLIIPDSHVYNGRVTAAGWIHLPFAIAATSVCAMLFLGMTDPPVSRTDCIRIGAALTAFCILGRVKFTRRWNIRRTDIWQICGEIALLWALVFARI